MIGIFILVLLISVALNISSRLINSVNERKERMNMEETMYSICSELRYNVSLPRIKQNLIERTIELNGTTLKEKSLTLDYNDATLNELLNKDIFLLGHEIDNEKSFKLMIIEDETEFIKLRITIKYKGEILEQEIIKATWMDEI